MVVLGTNPPEEEPLFLRNDRDRDVFDADEDDSRVNRGKSEQELSENGRYTLNKLIVEETNPGDSNSSKS